MLNKRYRPQPIPLKIRSGLPLVLFCLLLIGLTACGDTPTPTPTSTSQPQTSTPTSNNLITTPASSTSTTSTTQPALASATTGLVSAQPQAGTASTIDWKAVDQAMVKAGAIQPGNVYKFNLPRTDLQITLKGITLKAGFALGSHVEMLPMGNEVMAMGDLVLTEDEVEPVMLKLQQGGVNILALHNHLLGETPRVLYMHIGAQGDPVKLAGAIHTALSLSKTPFTSPGPGPTTTTPANNPTVAANQVEGLDVQQLDSLIGYPGKANSGIYQFSIARAEKVMDMGMELPNSMGIGTAINFQPTGAGKAAITGDFALLGEEVNPVIKALRENGIEVTALHSHMLSGTPQLFYMHFFAVDDQLKLAKGLRAALDQTNSAKPPAR